MSIPMLEMNLEGFYIQCPLKCFSYQHLLPNHSFGLYLNFLLKLRHELHRYRQLYYTNNYLVPYLGIYIQYTNFLPKVTPT